MPGPGLFLSQIIRKEGADMTKIKKRTERICQLWGWSLFIVSALFFCWASIRAEDVVSFFGGFFFLVACIVFLIPFFIKKNSDAP